MDCEDAATPTRTTTYMLALQTNGASDRQVETYLASSGSKKLFHPRTPNGSSSYGTSPSNTSRSTTTTSNCTTSFHVISHSSAVLGTPPAKRFHRVRNPFEAALAEHLHLPLIGSPSLFQRPVTPQLCSTQFEWTIDEVSSLKPAHVEPHETQFHDSPNPDLEAKAQSAISSYFKEHQIAPSPVDCPLRNHRIVLAEMNANTPICKPGRRIRDIHTQTELTLPPILPAALEEALHPYFQPKLAMAEASPEDASQQRMSTHKDTSNKDVSLRRKLFDLHNVIVLDNDGHAPAHYSPPGVHSQSSPLSVTTLQSAAIVGKLSDSMDKSSFGSLSPISATDGLSISSHSTLPDDTSNDGSDDAKDDKGRTRRSRLRNLLLTEVNELSPIHAPVSNVCKSQRQRKYRLPLINNSLLKYEAHADEEESDEVAAEEFKPEGSSSPCNGPHTALSELSTDASFNLKVSRLVVTSAKSLAHNDTDELLADYEDDDMHVSQLSGQSSSGSTCSSSNADTPRSRRRSASRKNLSQSFEHWLEEAEAEEQAQEYAAHEEQCLKIGNLLNEPRINELLQCVPQLTNHPMQITTDATEHMTNFYRIDSGFNELTNSSFTSTMPQQLQQQPQSPQRHQMLQQDVSMVCCSTPSKERII